MKNKQQNAQEQLTQLQINKLLQEKIEWETKVRNQREFRKEFKFLFIVFLCATVGVAVLFCLVGGGVAFFKLNPYINYKPLTEYKTNTIYIPVFPANLQK